MIEETTLDEKKTGVKSLLEQFKTAVKLICLNSTFLSSLVI